ncbi:MAG TPA: 30S ribosome-binding factor RbfA [Chloroflexota bacterium]|jgi:ribosome-binding factor A|nr:30S ribosome-binding factor RbfA [Chloroflexota bacterium]
MPSRRIERINHLLRQEIADLLAREIKDQALSSALISITDVDTSPDLRSAKVYFSVFGDEEVVKEAEAHLKRASGFLHNNLKERLDLRHTPHLEFVLDHSLETGARIMSLMRSIEEEREHHPDA